MTHTAFSHLNVVNKQPHYGTPRGDDKSTVYQILVRKPERNIALCRLKNTWENNIKIDMNDIRLEGAQ